MRIKERELTKLLVWHSNVSIPIRHTAKVTLILIELSLKKVKWVRQFDCPLSIR